MTVVSLSLMFNLEQLPDMLRTLNTPSMQVIDADTETLFLEADLTPEPEPEDPEAAEEPAQEPREAPTEAPAPAPTPPAPEAPAPPEPPARPPEATELMDEVLDTLRTGGPAKAADIADDIDQPLPAVKNALKRLKDRGEVVLAGRAGWKLSNRQPVDVDGARARAADALYEGGL